MSEMAWAEVGATDPVATDTDSPDYKAGAFEGATEDGTPELSEWDNESGRAT